MVDYDINVLYSDGMNKTTRHKTTIYLTEEMLQALRELAEQHDRSLNGEMLQAVKQYIEVARRKEQPHVSTANS